ncbi:uncharacterized protein LOC101901525 [Musca domestica]|uniref:Uncharacterized protein LOC101901525 n=1 Tax=Musca domestica TaxID=7370 RepID=A0A1I8N5S9_MUSDO|nr:uncharacterized protein LOC101901525 [Musca domestica]
MPASERYRTHDGTCNNKRRPRWGAAQMPFSRFLPPEYGDGVDSVRKSVNGGALSSSRFVSLLVHGARDGEAPLTLMLAQWGQLLDHDLTSTAQPRSINGSVPSCCGSKDFHPSCFPIKVPLDDPWLSSLKVRCLEFLRSAPAQRRDCVLSWREQTNQATSYIDASPIYSNSVKSSDNARVFRNGLLIFGRGNPNDDVCQRGAIATTCIRAGDGRSGEQPGLLALHHVWVGEHNHIALRLSEMNLHWSDEKIYQETRRIIGAMFQHITYREFLPIILGREVVKLFDLELLNAGYYEGYDHKTNPGVANAFAAAAFRFGHSLVQNSYMRCDRFHNVLSNNVSLHEEFQRGDIGSVGSLHRLIRGMANQRALQRDEFITPELTNHLFQTPGFPFGLDLAAINIQRGRDHGIPPYTHWRVPCGLSPINTWEEFANVVGPESARRISHAYQNVHDIDLFVGGIAERPVVGGLVGPTFACIIAQQFSNSRKGDRFWYENGGFESSFTPAQLHSIRRVTLASVLCRTVGGGTFQPHIFLPPNMPQNERLPCGVGPLAEFDLEPWLEQDPFAARPKPIQLPTPAPIQIKTPPPPPPRPQPPPKLPLQLPQPPLPPPAHPPAMPPSVSPMPTTFQPPVLDRIFEIVQGELQSNVPIPEEFLANNKVGFLNHPSAVTRHPAFVSPTSSGSTLAQRFRNTTKINDKLDLKRKGVQAGHVTKQKPIPGVNNKLDKHTRKGSHRHGSVHTTTTRRTIVVNNIPIELRQAPEEEALNVTNRRDNDKLESRIEEVTSDDAESGEDNNVEEEEEELESRTEGTTPTSNQLANDKLESRSEELTSEHRLEESEERQEEREDNMPSATEKIGEDDPGNFESRTGDMSLPHGNSKPDNSEQVAHGKDSPKGSNPEDNSNGIEKPNLNQNTNKEEEDLIPGPNLNTTSEMGSETGDGITITNTSSIDNNDILSSHTEELTTSSPESGIQRRSDDIEIIESEENKLENPLTNSIEESTGIRTEDSGSKRNFKNDAVHHNVTVENQERKEDRVRNSTPKINTERRTTGINPEKDNKDTKREVQEDKSSDSQGPLRDDTFKENSPGDAEDFSNTGENLTLKSIDRMDSDISLNSNDSDIDPLANSPSTEHRRVQRKLNLATTTEKLKDKLKFATLQSVVKANASQTLTNKTTTTKLPKPLRTSELRQYQKRPGYSKPPHKVIVGSGTGDNQYEIEINIRQTNKSPSPLESTIVDYSTNYKSKPYDRYTSNFGVFPSTTPLYGYYQPPPAQVSPPLASNQRTKPPTIIFLNEHDEHALGYTTKQPGFVHSIVSWNSGGSRPLPPSEIDPNDRPGYEGVLSRPILPSNYPNKRPAAATSFSQAQLNGGVVQASSQAISNGQYGSITGFASANGADSTFSFNIRPKPDKTQINRPTIDGLNSYGLVAAPPAAKPWYNEKPEQNPYEVPPRESIPSPFSTSNSQTYYIRKKTRPQLKEDLSYYGDPQLGDYGYLSRTRNPTLNISAFDDPDTEMEDESEYDSEDYGSSPLVRKFNRDGYLRPELMLESFNKTLNTDLPAEPATNMTLDDNYVLPVMNSTEDLPTDDPLEETNIGTTAFPDSEGKQLNNDIFADDMEESEEEGSFDDDDMEGDEGSSSLLEIQKRLSLLKQHQEKIAFAPITVLTKPERPDNWVIYESTKEEEPLPPQIPDLNLDSSPSAEIPKPIRENIWHSLANVKRKRFSQLLSTTHNSYNITETTSSTKKSSVSDTSTVESDENDTPTPSTTTTEIFENLNENNGDNNSGDISTTTVDGFDEKN